MKVRQVLPAAGVVSALSTGARVRMSQHLNGKALTRSPWRSKALRALNTDPLSLSTDDDGFEEVKSSVLTRGE